MSVHFPDAPDHLLDHLKPDQLPVLHFSGPDSGRGSFLRLSPVSSFAVERLCTGSSQYDHPAVLPAFYKDRAYGASEKRQINLTQEYKSGVSCTV